MNSRKWFRAAVYQKRPNSLGGWKKTQSTSTRRNLALGSRPKSWSLNKRRISAGRALVALSNVTKDKSTRIIAKRDSNYFFSKLKKRR